jgi:four helix bundle protein
VVLNLSEGSARTSQKERARFYIIAFASLREVQAVIDMEEGLKELSPLADKLGAHLYKLTH